jgi:CRP-like cAMP-binding protein
MRMDIDTALLRRTGLFQDMEDGDIRRLLDCLHCPVRRYGRGEFLWHAGDAVPMAGIVLEGCVDAVQYGEDGGAVLTARHGADTAASYIATG